MDNSGIIIFDTENGNTSIEVKLEKETVWLSQKQMSELFEKDSDTIGLHLKNIYNSNELEEFSTTEKYSVVRQEGNRKVKREINYYNLDAIYKKNEEPVRLENRSSIIALVFFIIYS